MFGENRNKLVNRPKNQKSADYLSLIELGQVSDFEITGAEAGFIMKIHAIRNKCLRDFSADEVRVCLVQDVGTVYLLTKALSLLETNPWIEAEHYDGDLLNTCIDIDGDCWDLVKDARDRMRAILATAKKQADEGLITIGRQEIRDLERGYRKFGIETEHAST